ncbi:MAG TPA: hypothetical protein VGR95_09490 [Thermoanaerobaculia bacterium]|jgi:hypothetical protein|nr:hypothetical protein [Thermoanaerobaculia bacterium]
MVLEEVVEGAWREVARLDPFTARKQMEAIARRQRDLLAFIMTMCEDLSAEAQEIAVYAFVVILRMFECSSVRQLPKVKRGRITAAYGNTQNELGRLTNANDRFIERHAEVSSGTEPFVMRYITEVLLEPENPEDALPDDEIGAVFMYLKTVVDVLHEITEPDPERS